MNAGNCLVLTILVILFGFLFMNRYIAMDGFVGSRIQRCGVGIAPCPYKTRCVNGFCRSQENPPQLYDRNPLPVVP